MQETDNLRLRKPEYNDTVDIEDLNYNTDVIDEAYESLKQKTQSTEDNTKSTIDEHITSEMPHIALVNGEPVYCGIEIEDGIIYVVYDDGEDE